MKRKDGRRIKTINPMYKVIPHVMQDRIGSQLYYTVELLEEPFNDYIKSLYEKGHSVTLMAILMASMVRLMALRPALNRFVVKGKVYARNSIQVSITIKKYLSDDSPDENLKFTFTGHESVLDVQEMIDKEIRRLKNKDESNDATKLTWIFDQMPNWLIRFAINALWWMDHHNVMPSYVMNASPFHTSLYFTNLRSIKLDKLYHHLYEFGTAGTFVSLGKSVKKPVVIDDEIQIRKSFKMGFVFDERMCDGFYFSMSLRELERIIGDLETLNERLETVAEDIP